MDEHVLRDAEDGDGVQVGRGGDGNLEPAHVPRVARIFQTVLVAFEEEFQLKPETKNQKK